MGSRTTAQRGLTFRQAEAVILPRRSSQTGPARPRLELAQRDLAQQAFADGGIYE